MYKPVNPEQESRWAEVFGDVIRAARMAASRRHRARWCFLRGEPRCGALEKLQDDCEAEAIDVAAQCLKKWKPEHASGNPWRVYVLGCVKRRLASKSERAKDRAGRCRGFLEDRDTGGMEYEWTQDDKTREPIDILLSDEESVSDQARLKLMDKLPYFEFLTLLLRHRCGSLAAVAKTMGSSESSVKRWYESGLAKLKAGVWDEAEESQTRGRMTRTLFAHSQAAV